MHNMMVAKRIGNDEIETHFLWSCTYAESANNQDKSDANSSDEDYYNESSDNDSDDATVGTFEITSDRESILKYKIVQERWKKLYSFETSLRLQDALKNHVFKKHFGDDGTLSCKEMA